MRGLSAGAILEAWEVGEPRLPLDRSLVLLWAAGETGPLSALPLAERDRRLLAVRAATFGDGLDCVTTCPECAASLEFRLSARELAARLSAPQDETIEQSGVRLGLRAINSRDLGAAVALPADEAQDFLLGCACPDLDDAPTEAMAEIESRVEAREKTGELTFALTCADCAAAWREAMDVGAFVWQEVATAARRIMGEVAELAAVFGWSEADILALSEPRRRSYLAIARGA